MLTSRPADCSATDSGFTACARALNIDFYALHAMLHSNLSRGLRSGLCCERRGLSGASEAELTGAGPGNSIALGIGDGNNGIVERGLNMSGATLNILALTASADCGYCFLSAFL